MKVLVIALVVLAMTTGLEAGSMARGAGGGLRYGDRRCRGGRGRWNSRLYHSRIRCRLNLGSRNRGGGGMAVGEPFNNNNNNQDYEDDDQEEPCIGICLHLKMQREAAEKAEKEKERQEEKQRRRQERREAKERRQMEREAEPKQVEREAEPKQVESEDPAELERQLQRQKPKTTRQPERVVEAEEALERLLQRKEKVKQKLTKDMEDNQEEEQINGIKNMEESPRVQPEPCVGICYLKKLQRIAAEEARANQRKRNVESLYYDDYYYQ